MKRDVVVVIKDGYWIIQSNLIWNLHNVPIFEWKAWGLHMSEVQILSIFKQKGEGAIEVNDEIKFHRDQREQ